MRMRASHRVGGLRQVERERPAQVFAIEMRGEATAHFLNFQVQIVAQLILVGGKRRGGVDHQAALDDLIGKGLQLLIHREHETGVLRDPRRILVLDDVLAVAPNGRPADIVEHGGEPLVGLLKVALSLAFVNSLLSMLWGLPNIEVMRVSIRLDLPQEGLP